MNKKILLGLALLFPITLLGNSGGHEESHFLIGLLVITLGCTILGGIFSKAKLPTILASIVAGAVVSNLHIADEAIHSQALAILGMLGVCFLMFEAGLEANLDDIKKNGTAGSLVAVLGVVFVGVLGYIVSIFLLPKGSHWFSYIFVAAALTPTSAGIAAALFGEKKQSSSPEGITVLIGAIIDDVIGLVILAVMSGIAESLSSGKEIEMTGIAITTLKAVAFLVGGILIGRYLSIVIFKSTAGIQNQNMLLGLSLSIALLFGVVAMFAGLAPLIGTYVAGLILEKAQYKSHISDDLTKLVEDSEKELKAQSQEVQQQDYNQRLRTMGNLLKKSESHQLEEAIKPFSLVFAPIFFFSVGAQLKLDILIDINVWLLAIALTAACMIGKIMSGIGVISKSTQKLPVILGMMPRGEVAAIMIAGGAVITINGQALISGEIYGAFVLMILLTTLVSIIGLNKVLKHGDSHSTSH